MNMVVLCVVLCYATIMLVMMRFSGAMTCAARLELRLGTSAQTILLCHIELALRNHNLHLNSQPLDDFNRSFPGNPRDSSDVVVTQCWNLTDSLVPLLSVVICVFRPV